MRLDYSPRADALYVYFDDADARPVAYTEDASPGGQYERGVDYAEDGTLVGVEFLNASRGVDLAGIPRADEIAAVLGRVKQLPILEAR